MDYKKVIEDSTSGKIDPNEWRLVMDNDGGYWQYIGGSEDDDFLDREYNRMTRTYGNPEGYRDIVDVLNAAGVNSEWC